MEIYVKTTGNAWTWFISFITQGSRSRYVHILCALITCLSLQLFSPFIAGTTPAAQAKASQNGTLYADTVLVMDNVDQIATHDTNGNRFDASQLYVDMTPPGDQIGLTQITSSPTLNANQWLTLQDTTPDGKKKIKTAIQQIRTAGVDPKQTAYFTPALRKAGDILSASQAGHRKYIFIVTDALAESGDAQNNCNTPQHQQWLCEVDTLESQGISVVLIAFTRYGHEAEFNQTNAELQAHRATATAVFDQSSLSVLAEQYMRLLTDIHPAIFSTKLNGAPSLMTITADEKPTRLTFVALGDQNVSLSSLKEPDGQDIVGKNASDGSLYSATGHGYVLMASSTGNLIGQWQNTAGASPPSEMIVLVQSQGRFQLKNPIPSGDDLSIRYVAAGAQLVLRASLSDADGNPLSGISLTANPQSGSGVALTPDTLPGISPDIGAILGIPPAGATTLFVGLGSPLTTKGGNIYLTKSFQLEARTELQGQGVTLHVPDSTSPTIAIGAHSTANAATLALFGRNPSGNQGWVSIQSQNDTNNIQGNFLLTRGCGARYQFETTSEFQGKILGAQYDYIAYQEQDYLSHIAQTITGQATPQIAPYLEWWSTTAKWNLNFTSSACSTQQVSLNMKIQGNNFSPPAFNWQGAVSPVTISSNTQTNVSMVATVGGCWPGLVNHTASMLLTPSNAVGAGNTFNQLQPNNWRVTVTCPSIFTNTGRYLLPALLIWILISILLSQLVQKLFLLVLPIPGPHIVGSVQVTTDALVYAGVDLRDMGPSIPVTVNIPMTAHEARWYLERHNEAMGTNYVFTRRETLDLALLVFELHTDESGQRVSVAATRYATGENLPEFLLSHTPIGQDAVICEGEPIVINRDLIVPSLKVAIW